jgi:hypothetical protein
MRILSNAVLGLAVFVAAACTRLMPIAQDASDLFACRCKALEPYLGAVLDVEDLVRRVGLGELDLRKVLAGAGYAAETIEKACAEVNSCSEPELLHGPSLVAPPPAPGNKVM